MGMNSFNTTGTNANTYRGISISTYRELSLAYRQYQKAGWSPRISAAKAYLDRAANNTLYNKYIGKYGLVMPLLHDVYYPYLSKKSLHPDYIQEYDEDKSFSGGTIRHKDLDEFLIISAPGHFDNIIGKIGLNKTNFLLQYRTYPPGSRGYCIVML